MIKNTPIFSKFADKTTIIGIGISGYLYSIYTFLPNYIYEPLITILPVSGAISYLFLPKLKRLIKLTNIKSIDNKEQNVVEQVNESQENDIENNDDIANTEEISEDVEHKAIDESLIQELIDQKLSSMLEEFNSNKQQLEDSLNSINNVMSEMDELKSSIDELKKAFETTLVDFKAFQTEIANPLNFMRKYFESIDIKNLSDPTLPLQFNNQVTNSENENVVVAIENESLHEIDNHNGKEEVKDVVDNLTSNGLNITSYIHNSMSLANIMELVSSLGEFIEKFGEHYHDILATQCKILGLDKEREELLYNIANTLSHSKTSAYTYIESLYRLATVMGIKDEKVDAIYNRLMRRKKVKRRMKNKR